LTTGIVEAFFGNAFDRSLFFRCGLAPTDRRCCSSGWAVSLRSGVSAMRWATCLVTADLGD